MRSLHNASYRERLERILYKVARPSAYINSEIGCVLPPDISTRLKVAISYPDLYEIGQSNLGINTVHSLINTFEGMFCDRVYNVRSDMGHELRRAGLPLATLAANIPLRELDVIGITLQSELTYTNILSLLDLGGVPLRSEERGKEDPIIIAGGPLAFAPEPLAPYVDVFFIGDAEARSGSEIVTEEVTVSQSFTGRENTLLLESILRQIRMGKDAGLSRQDVLGSLLQFKNLYVPQAYRWDDSLGSRTLTPSWPGADVPVKRAILKDLNDVPQMTARIVPYAETMHNRLSVEVMRGCTRGCRFCFAGMIYRPFREKDRAHILQELSNGLFGSGYGEYSLASLSTSDHSDIARVLEEGADSFGKHKIAAALPSLRLDSFDIGLLRDVMKVKRTGLTFAPEAGSRRLRRVINKHLEEEELEGTIREVFTAGWQRVKLYFMIGLPGETDEDVRSIGGMARHFMDIARQVLPKGARGRAKIAVNLGMFVPKPFTPFQWAPMIHPEEAVRRINMVKEEVASIRQVEVKWQDPWMSFVEGMLSRGDHISARLVQRAYEKGAGFDQWSEHFNKDIWLAAADELKKETGVDIIERALAEMAAGSTLPWDHIDAGISRDFLMGEWQKAIEAIETGDCRTEKCTLCGVCMTYEVRNIAATLGSVK